MSTDISDKAREMLKAPYIFDFLTEKEDMKELTSNITKLLLELGNGLYHLEIEIKVII